MRRHLLVVFSLLCLLSCKEPVNKPSLVEAAQDLTAKPKQLFTDTTACVFAQLAYCKDPQRELDSLLPGWKVAWNPLPLAGNYAFVATDSNQYVLAFRGSLITFTEDAFNNWITNDLNVTSQDPWSYSKKEKTAISHGSFLGFQNIERMRDRKTGKSLWSFLSEKVTDQYPLVVTGHSLGGNLAMVYASYLSSKFDKSGHPKNNINVITFAAPAPGNTSFADDFNEKFPLSERIENTNDIVPKFPCSNKITQLGDMYMPGPSASTVVIGYKNMTTKLNNVFTLISSGLAVLELRDGFSGYTHTNGNGKLITIALSGKDTLNTAASWFAEAGFQHSMAQYAGYFNAPVIKSE
ncbi:MAG TPA: lipase family protein [Chitinophagaceae bacterium]|nr:lipase family protein [Chitinophagaceae bacterium]